MHGSSSVEVRGPYFPAKSHISGIYDSRESSTPADPLSMAFLRYLSFFTPTLNLFTPKQNGAFENTPGSVRGSQTLKKVTGARDSHNIFLEVRIEITEEEKIRRA